MKSVYYKKPLLSIFSSSYGWFGSGGTVLQLVAVCVSFQVSWISIQVKYSWSIFFMHTPLGKD